MLAAIALTLLAAVVMTLWLASRMDGGTRLGGETKSDGAQVEPDDAGKVDPVGTGEVDPVGTGKTGNTSSLVVSGPQAPPGMVYVPGGTFTIGSDEGDEYEKPAHAVTVRPFFIDQYEVTNEEYAKFLRETGRRPPPTWKGGGYAEGEARRPVTGVTWDDANAYARWAGKRLPAEEEWECAARGTDGHRYPWGNKWRAGAANVDRPSGGLTEVGRYPDGRSPFGAFDMIGNVWEWTGSSLTPYRRGEEVGRLPNDLPDNAMVIRGGSFATRRARATATYRGYRGIHSPGDEKTGFRCVREVDTGPGR
jgi:serine/threonine-protein kinase